MFEKNVGKIVLHIVVNVTLIVFYVFFFGLPSFSQYLNKAVIITNLEDTPSVIPSPGKIKYISLQSSKQGGLQLSSHGCLQS